MPMIKNEHERDLSTFRQSRELVFKDKKCMLTIYLRMRPYMGYKSCTRLEVDVYYNPSKKAKEYIGHITAWLVDKTVKDQDGNALWLKELVGQDDKNIGDATCNLRQATRKLFKASGRPRVMVDLRKEDVTLEKMVFINDIDPGDYDGGEVAQEMMYMFHDLVREMIDCEAPTAEPVATMIVTPGVGLEKLYGRYGYKIWIKGQDTKETTFVLLGRAL